MDQTLKAMFFKYQAPAMLINISQVISYFTVLKVLPNTFIALKKNQMQQIVRSHHELFEDNYMPGCPWEEPSVCEPFTQAD